MRASVMLIIWMLASPWAAGQSNVLMLLADDVGVDTVQAYGEHPVPARTPHIDGLAERGILFRNAYANPACSPTRATMLSGRYGWRTGIGTVFALEPAIPAMQLTGFTSLPDSLATVGYATAVVGKWHLGNNLEHPLHAGFDEVHGSTNSISDYYQFQKNVNGEAIWVTTYATADTVDDALALMESLPEPWFIWVAFNAAHTPYHTPPSELHSYELPKQITGNEPIYSRAIIEAMDTEIGRLLQDIDADDTTIIFLGDNGPEGDAVLPPWTKQHAKATVYEQGVRVPLIVVGPGVVQGAECKGLVNTTDVYSTIAELAGAPHETALDSVSLVPYLKQPELPSLREFAFVESFIPNFAPEAGFPKEFLRRSQAVRGTRYKLVHRYDTPTPSPVIRELYDLLLDPLETANLLDAELTPELQEAHKILAAQIVKNGPSPWKTLDGGLAGVLGVPSLEGCGPLVPGTTTTLQLSRAVAQAPGTLVIGWEVAPIPFLCGTMIPTMDQLLPLTTNPSGAVTWVAKWPAVPSCTAVTFQAWVSDEAAPCGYSASNGLTAITAP